MRLLSRVLAIVPVVCLIAIALPSVPAQAQCEGPFIELSPESGLPGTEVTVYGYDCADDKIVDIYYDGKLIATDRTSSKGDFTIFLTVPEGCSGHYQVFADVGYASVDTYFTVKPGLTISPEQGPIGTAVTVKGQGFAKDEQGIELIYYLNDAYETIERNIVANAKGSWERSFQVPPSTRGEHKMDAEGIVSRLHEVKNAIFRVTSEISIDKSAGIVGDTITMTANKFAASEKGIEILFDGEAVATDIKANSEGEWQASFDVPEMPTGEYSVTAEGEQTSKEDVGDLSFEIQPEFILSHDQGHVGMDLTVTGRGFPAYEDIIILYDDSQVVIAETDDQGSFEASFSVPESKHGEHLVRARPTGGTNNTADLEINASTTFTMEWEPPPVPTPISPTDRSWLGFLSEVAPTFEWSEVSDESGVAYYNLRIATSADFTTSSLVVSVTDLTETSYTLKETEALPLGTYYWVVQAVDGAENESDGTTTRSFRVGLLPRWAFILSIIVIVVLFVALIRALVRRRTIYYDGW